MYRFVVVNDNAGGIWPGIMLKDTGARNPEGFELATVFIISDSVQRLRDIPNDSAPSVPHSEGFSWRELTQNERNIFMSSFSKISQSFGDALGEGGIQTVSTPTTDF